MAGPAAGLAGPGPRVLPSALTSAREPAIHDLVSRIRRLGPSCGPVRLVGVDGHAGSGKSTFAGLLAGALDGAPVLRLDDIASHEELFGWTARLLSEVIEPLGRGETAHYSPYDWRTRRFGPPRLLPPAPVIVVEGVGAGRRALRPHLALLLWMDLPREESWSRGRERDGEEQREFWDGWVRAESEHFAGDPSRPFADLLVRQRQEGYKLLTGPAGTDDPPPPLTHGDDPSAMW